MAGLLHVGEMGALAMHVVLQLAVLQARDEDARQTVQELAEGLSASPHTLQKVTRRLIAIGLLESSRGSSGGLKLAVDPGTIDILQILEGIEGTICANGCLFAKRVCVKGAPCVFKKLTCTLEKQIRDAFTGTTIADLRDAALRLFDT